MCAVPNTPELRRAAWVEGVFAALAVFRRLMADPDTPERLAFACAEKIFQLEMARMRHGRPVSGTEGADVDENDPPAGVGVPGGGSERDRRGRSAHPLAVEQ